MGLLFAVFDFLLMLGSIALAVAWRGRLQQVNSVVSLAFGGQALLLLVAGAIFLFQGWRLDPLLSFATLLIHLMVVASMVKDWILLAAMGDR
jgi:hypothetical protein